MKLADALKQVDRPRSKCRVSTWFGTLDAQTVKEIDDALASGVSSYKVYRAAILMGYSNSRSSWENHYRGTCNCDK